MVISSAALGVGLHEFEHPIYMSPIDSVLTDVFPVTYEVKTLVFSNDWVDVVARYHGDQVTDVRERMLLAQEGLRLMHSRLRKALR